MYAGKYDQMITFERVPTIENDYGEQVPDPANPAYDLARAWAQVRAGTGQERRQAAQESAEQTRTFVTDWNPTLESVTVKDRISYRGGEWDITDVALDANREIQFTATRGQ